MVDETLGCVSPTELVFDSSAPLATGASVVGSTFAELKVDELGSSVLASSFLTESRVLPVAGGSLESFELEVASEASGLGAAVVVVVVLLLVVVVAGSRVVWSSWCSLLGAALVVGVSVEVCFTSSVVTIFDVDTSGCLVVMSVCTEAGELLSSRLFSVVTDACDAEETSCGRSCCCSELDSVPGLEVVGSDVDGADGCVTTMDGSDVEMSLGNEVDDEVSLVASKLVAG